MFRRDLEAAGIPYAVDGPDDPLYADFHAVRHSYVALLDNAGVSLKQAMQLARHFDPRLTMARYGRAQLADLGATVGRLPSLTSPTRQAEVVALPASGTDGEAAWRLAPRCTNVAQTVDPERRAVSRVDARSRQDGNEETPVIPGVLSMSEANRVGLKLIHLAGLEPATFGSVVEVSQIAESLWKCCHVRLYDISSPFARSCEALRKSARKHGISGRAPVETR
jgi:hypothetical protein